MWILSGGFDRAFFGSAWGVSLTVGAVAALLGFLIGLLVMRPASTRMLEIGPRLADTASPEDAQELGAEMTALRKRAGASARWVALLLLIAVLAMAAAEML